MGAVPKPKNPKNPKYKTQTKTQNPDFLGVNNFFFRLIVSKYK